MADAELERKVVELFATILEVEPDQVSDTTRPADLARWDSMQHLILVSGFEEEFELDLDPEEAVRMYSDFATFKAIVLQKLASVG